MSSNTAKEMEPLVQLMETIAEGLNESVGVALTETRQNRFSNIVRSQEIALTSKLLQLEEEEKSWLSLKAREKHLASSSTIFGVEMNNDKGNEDDATNEEDNFELEEELDEEENHDFEAILGDPYHVVGKSAIAERRVESLVFGLDQIGVRFLDSSVVRFFHIDISQS